MDRECAAVRYFALSIASFADSCAVFVSNCVPLFTAPDRPFVQGQRIDCMEIFHVVWLWLCFLVVDPGFDTYPVPIYLRMKHAYVLPFGHAATSTAFVALPVRFYL